MSTPQYNTFEEYKTSLVEQVLKGAETQWKQIETQQRLASLYKEFGFRSNADLVKALQSVATTPKSPSKAKGAAKPKGGKAKAGKGKRAKITPEIEAKVKELKLQGIASSAIARTLGISSPSVYKITKGIEAPVTPAVAEPAA
ncbi:MAG: hypothetical protein LBS59_08445 [Puniceicoccales bacterium]|nr:hypothetical protein [Puniceicoccales bacterium]